MGLRPQLEIARAAGLATNRGIVTDGDLATSAPHIYALGDCAEVQGLVQPYVAPIMHQARALASTLCGERINVVYPAMPIIVKTPACPVTVCTVAPGGEWVNEETEDGLVATRATSERGTSAFALLGSAAAPRRPKLMPLLRKG